MKKSVLSGVFTLALLSTAGFGVQGNMDSDAGLNDLALTNVKALTNGESGGSRSYQSQEYLHYAWSLRGCSSSGAYTCTYRLLKQYKQELFQI